MISRRPTCGNIFAICSTSSGLAARPPPRVDDDDDDDREEGEETVAAGREKKKYRMAMPEMTRTMRSWGMLIEVEDIW